MLANLFKEESAQLSHLCNLLNNEDVLYTKRLSETLYAFYAISKMILVKSQDVVVGYQSIKKLARVTNLFSVYVDDY